MFLVFTQVWEAEHMVSVSTHLNPKFCNSDVPISKVLQFLDTNFKWIVSDAIVMRCAHHSAGYSIRPL